MSKSVSEVSAKGQDEQENDSVYDFLYQDARRIGSFLAQFYNSGHLQSITESEGIRRQHERGFKINLGATIPGLPGANLGFERGPKEGGGESIERVYDPLWANALDFLDSLEARSLINRDVTSARVGQFVLGSGELSILQMTLLKGYWSGPNFKEKAIDTQIANAMAKMLGAPQMADQSGVKKVNRDKMATAKQARANALLAFEVIEALPHLVQATLTGGAAPMWCVLSEDWLIPSPSDITLKYGSLVMTGEWHILGILDAVPSEVPPTVEVAESEVPQHLGAVVGNMSNLARTILGRPTDCYGVTPLVIFRKVA